MWETIKNDPLIKAVAVIILGLIVFGFFFNMIFGGNMMYGTGFGAATILLLLAKALMLMSILGFVIGAAVYVVSSLKEANTKGAQKTNEEKFCESCGMKISEAWIYCPKCSCDLKENQTEAQEEKFEEEADINPAKSKRQSGKNKRDNTLKAIDSDVIEQTEE